MKRQELIEKWLEALESGEYKQGNGYLVTEDSKGKNKRFCCLGVACDVVNQDIDFLLENAKQALPLDVAKKFGMDTFGDFIVPIQYRGKTYNDLTELNDGGVKFKTIARIIREQLAKKNFAKL